MTILYRAVRKGYPDLGRESSYLCPTCHWQSPWGDPEATAKWETQHQEAPCPST